MRSEPERNPWRRVSHPILPRRDRGIEPRARSQLSRDNRAFTPAGARFESEIHSTGCARLKPASLHPWLHPGAPLGRSYRRRCVNHSTIQRKENRSCHAQTTAVTTRWDRTVRPTPVARGSRYGQCPLIHRTWRRVTGDSYGTATAVRDAGSGSTKRYSVRAAGLVNQPGDDPRPTPGTGGRRSCACFGHTGPPLSGLVREDRWWGCVQGDFDAISGQTPVRGGRSSALREASETMREPS